MSRRGNSSYFPNSFLDRLECLAHVAVLAGAVFVVYQFLQAQQSARVERAIAYVERFQNVESGIGAAQRAIDRMVWNNSDSINRLRQAAKEGARPTDTHRRLMRQLIKDYSTEELSIPQQINEIVSFMDEINICVNQDICDNNTIMEYFSEYASRFLRNFRPYLAEIDTEVGGYTEGIERVAKMEREKLSTGKIFFVVFLLLVPMPIYWLVRPPASLTADER